MRFLLASVGVLVSCLVLAEPAEENPLKVPPDVAIVVTKMPIGADQVKITTRNPNYPLELLSAQINELGRLLGSTPRGVYVFPTVPDNNEKLRMVRGEFAVDGLIDRQAGTLRLQEVVRAFAGAPQGLEVRAMHVIFENEVVQPGMLQSLLEGTVRLLGSASQSPPGIEYRILLLTQDPEKIVIPAKVSSTQPSPTTSPEQSRNIHPLAIPIALGGCVVAGALVYFGFRTPRRRSAASK
ncbi:MAG: hypothetical protein MUC92_04220 [Fimbriimonadaceae bacterium]|nr:hypothetical protein [Fimbriimonadaceae bacterium]